MRVLIDIPEDKIQTIQSTAHIVGTDKELILDNLFGREDIEDTCRSHLEGLLAYSFERFPKFREAFIDSPMASLKDSFNAEQGVIFIQYGTR